jgi:hypothetical protein
MNTFKTLLFCSLVGGLLLGCDATSSSPSRASGAKSHFRDARSANVVLQFSSWEYTFMLQPRYDDNGFLLQVPRAKVGQVLSQLNVHKRDLAVVVIGWNYDSEQLHKLVTDWKLILFDCGFQRVVLIKSRRDKELNGAWVIDDSLLSGGRPPSITQL